MAIAINTQRSEKYSQRHCRKKKNMVEKIAEIKELENSFLIVTVNKRNRSFLKNAKEIDGSTEKQGEAKQKQTRGQLFKGYS